MSARVHAVSATSYLKKPSATEKTRLNRMGDKNAFGQRPRPEDDASREKWVHW